MSMKPLVSPRTPLPDHPEEAELYEELISYIRTKPQSESSLIDILHYTQDAFGYIPRTAVLLIGEMLNLPAAKIYGVVTFYSYFTENPKGKYPISVCLGTACYVKGAQKILDNFKKSLGVDLNETTDDQLFTLVETRCLGDCSHAPIVQVGSKVWTEVNPDQVEEIIAYYRHKEEVRDAK